MNRIAWRTDPKRATLIFDRPATATCQDIRDLAGDVLAAQRALDLLERAGIDFFAKYREAFELANIRERL